MPRRQPIDETRKEINLHVCHKVDPKSVQEIERFLFLYRSYVVGWYGWRRQNHRSGVDSIASLQ